jgi:hypothetical protein
VPTKSTVLLAICVLPFAAGAAEPIPAGGVAELSGPRAVGIGAAVGIASGNDAIYVNPGALAARRRYSAEAQLWVERRGAENAAQVWTGSVADSLSGPVAAAVAYGRVTDGYQTGSLYHLAMAGAIAQGIYLGVSGKYFDLSPGGVSAATVDAGLFWEPSDGISVGVAGYNLAPTSHDAELPRGVGAGISLGSDTSLHGTFDWRADLDRAGETTNRWAFGAEVLLGGVAPLRAGYVIDETLDTKWWSIGAGLVSANGGGIDLAYRQSVDDPSARVISVAAKLQFAQ